MAINWPAMAMKLLVLRQRCGMSQKVLATASGVGEKVISSFESGRRLPRIKLAQLDALVTACNMTLGDFIAWGLDGFDEDMIDDDALDTAAERIASRDLPPMSNYPTPQSSLSAAADVHISLPKHRR